VLLSHRLLYLKGLVLFLYMVSLGNFKLKAFCWLFVIRKHVIWINSTHWNFGKFPSTSKHCVIFNKDFFPLSTNPFYYGVHDGLNSLLIPTPMHKSKKAYEEHSFSYLIWGLWFVFQFLFLQIFWMFWRSLELTLVPQKEHPSFL